METGLTGVLDGADVVGPESAVHVDRGDALVVAGRAGAVRRGQRGRTLLQVPRLEPADRQRFNDSHYNN